MAIARVGFILNLSILISIAVIFVNAGEDDGCVDKATWCESLAGRDLCHIDTMINNCKKTCKLCLPLECKRCDQRCNLETTECLCLDGYRLNADNQTCDDIDECSENVSPCNETHPICQNNLRGYACLSRDNQCLLDKSLINYYMKDSCCQKSTGEPQPNCTDSLTITNVFDPCLNTEKYNFAAMIILVKDNWLLGKCGLSSLNTGRIVGGIDTDTMAWPWLVHFIIDNKHLCGGSLLNNEWIVGAAHCFNDFKNDLNKIAVTVGMSNTTDNSETSRQTRKIKQVIIHEDYVFPDNDIALIKLASPVKWSAFVGPICLPNGEVPKVGEKCFAIGYGRLNVSGPVADVLQEVDLPIVDDLTCTKAYENESEKFNPKSMTCAGYSEGGKDACQGDSGGPLACQRCDSCDFYLVGITSFGKGCATPGEYGAFTKVEVYENWIAEKISTVKITKNKCIKTEWDTWSDWSKCTAASCKEGVQIRVRSCLNGVAGQSGCLGEESQSRICEDCIGETVLGDWGAWSECSETCGSGIARRSRSCFGEEILCLGSTEQTAVCNSFECDSTKIKWVWSECSASCGKGVQTGTKKCHDSFSCPDQSTTQRDCNTKPCPSKRLSSVILSECTVTCGGGVIKTRKCDGSTCSAFKLEKQVCNIQPCPILSDWIWNECDKTCGKGTQRGRRTCLNGVIGDLGCEGETTQQRPCNTETCPIISTWTQWSACSATCGKGEQTKSCIDCKVSTRTRVCNLRPCPKWRRWGMWSECSRTCGPGTQIRKRKCSDQQGDCEGPETELKVCSNQECSIAWFGLWSDWSSCTVSCGGGNQIRVRICENSERCVGPRNLDSRFCNKHPCPKWSNWSQFSTCSKTCNSGVRSRIRTCIMGTPGDAGCEGKVVTEIVECNKDIKCRPYWENWGEWSKCSSTCGTSFRSQRRKCIGQSKETGNCLGNSTKTENCNQPACPRKELWSRWSSCSTMCGGGKQTRKIICTEGNCDNNKNSETRSCNEQPCKWTFWSKFSPCTKTCQGGQKTRYRLCLGNIPGVLGCEGGTKDTQKCNEEIRCRSYWESWGEWGECSSTCGPSSRSRKRKCVKGVDDCIGNSTQTETCIKEDCPTKDLCSDECKKRVEEGFCFNTYFDSFGCSPSCCECVDTDSCNFFSMLLGCSYDCKFSCNLCKADHFINII